MIFAYRMLLALAAAWCATVAVADQNYAVERCNGFKFTVIDLDIDLEPMIKTGIGALSFMNSYKHPAHSPEPSKVVCLKRCIQMPNCTGVFMSTENIDLLPTDTDDDDCFMMKSVTVNDYTTQSNQFARDLHGFLENKGNHKVQVYLLDEAVTPENRRMDSSLTCEVVSTGGTLRLATTEAMAATTEAMAGTTEAMAATSIAMAATSEAMAASTTARAEPMATSASRPSAIAIITCHDTKHELCPANAAYDITVDRRLAVTRENYAIFHEHMHQWQVVVDGYFNIESQCLNVCDQISTCQGVVVVDADVPTLLGNVGADVPPVVKCLLLRTSPETVEALQLGLFIVAEGGVRARFFWKAAPMLAPLPEEPVVDGTTGAVNPAFTMTRHRRLLLNEQTLQLLRERLVHKATYRLRHDVQAECIAFCKGLNEDCFLRAHIVDGRPMCEGVIALTDGAHDILESATDQPPYNETCILLVTNNRKDPELIAKITSVDEGIPATFFWKREDVKDTCDSTRNARSTMNTQLFW